MRLAAIFGFQGRMGRLGFFGYYTLLYIYAVIWGLAFSGLAKLPWAWAIALLTAAPLIWAAVALLVRRLHDMDMSGWHVLWVCALRSVAMQTSGVVGAVFSIAFWGVVAWLCLEPGSPGPNRFGTRGGDPDAAGIGAPVNVNEGPSHV